MRGEIADLDIERRVRVDPMDVLIPPGDYIVGFVSVDTFSFQGGRRMAVRFRICEGPYTGFPLLRFYSLPVKGMRPRRSSSLRADYERVTGRVFPKATVRPQDFLRGIQVRTRVVTVTHDTKGIERPPAQHYSRIDALVEQLAGSLAQAGTPS